MIDLNAVDWQKIKLISFDLDDTLWDNSGVIEKCLQELYNFLIEHEPKVQKHFSIYSMERISEQLIQLQKPEYENMTVLRKAVIKQMLEEVDGDLSLVNPAFGIFFHWRNQVAIPKITYEVLEHLKSRFILVATSNGNSNLHSIGINDYFKQHYVAGIDGRAKPNPEMLIKIIEDFNLNAEEVVHIGDSEETDVLSAIKAKLAYLKLDITQLEVMLKI